VRHVELKSCKNITNAAVVALAEHCIEIQTIDLNGCSNITDAAAVALAEHCSGVQTIYLGGCPFQLVRNKRARRPS
jgi:hypothetical protein